MNTACPRCQGLVIGDRFLCETNYWLEGLRCLNCGWVRLKEKAISYANQTKDKRTHKLDELQLYRARSRSAKLVRNT